MKTIITSLLLLVSTTLAAQSVPMLETGGDTMPDEWIDRDTGHRIIKLTRRPGSNASFYFHNNPFIGNEMVFRGSDVAHAGNDMVHAGGPQRRTQMYAVDLGTLAIRQLTDEPFNVSTEIVCPRTHELFYQHGDTVFALNTDRLERRTVAVMPRELRGGIITVNADGTLLAGKLDDPEERRILQEHPKKNEFFNLIFNARLKKTIFTIDTRTGSVDTIYSERAWLNHLQFSPTAPTLLMFCHEGPWHEVDRIWTIDVVKRGQPQLIHRRTMHREIAGHEWWGADGRHIYFDLQKPRGETFYVGKTNVYTGEEQDYQLQRHEWSVHFVSSWDERTLAGDGGSKTSVAHSPEGQWIYHFEYDGQRLRSRRLVNMKHHDYKLEPNIHFSPDQRWIIFRANFEGVQNVYAVEVAPSAEVGFVRPAQPWPDADGTHINAHGGGMLLHDGVYYWFGEHKAEHTSAAMVGVTCYSSTDLVHWQQRGVALGVSAEAGSDIERGCIIERPKVVYNALTGKFVMWFHLELRGRGYEAARYGVAVSDRPEGPYTYLYSGRANAGRWPVEFTKGDIKRAQRLSTDDYKEWWTPRWRQAVADGLFVNRDLEGGQMSRDMTLFVDDDGTAYHIYSSEENLTIHIAELTPDYQHHTGRYTRLAPGGHNEAPTIFKHDGRYWMITSGCTGWDPNEARMFSADSIWGPWTQHPNPCVGPQAEKTFGGQGTFVLTLPDGRHIFMADVWRPRRPIDAKYIWLPITFSDGKPVVRWQEQWAP